MALTRGQQQAELLDTLRGFTFARGADAEAMERLANMAVCHDYPKRNILFYRGEPASAVYLVVKGKVKLLLDNEEGREVVVTLLRPGDLFGSGTVSGPSKDAFGCLLEITRRGQEPIELPGGETRTFLRDGDEVVLRGYCEREGYRRIGLGECRGRVLPAPNG